ncbi:MAG: plasmid partitioning protein RepB C-terminal domain-containing protein, partial [Pseudomonadota bacterium]
KATFSKMLAVAGIEPRVLAQLQSATSIGRDRWYELKNLLDRPANLKRAMTLIESQDFLDLEGDKRFDHLFSALKRSRKPTKGTVPKAQSWSPKDKGVEVQSSTRGKSFTIAVKARDQSGIEFGEFVSKRLDDLYEQFKAETKT